MQIHVFIAHMTVGGAERVCVNLCNEFAQRGHEVHLVLLDLDNDVNSHLLDERVQIHNLKVHRFRYAAPAMTLYLRKYRPDFMLIFGMEMAVIVNRLRKLKLTKVKPVVRVLNNVNISLSREDKVSPVVENYLKRSQVQMADMAHIVAQCKAMGRMIVEKGLVEPDRLSVIYNPVSADLLSKVEKLRQTKSCGDKQITFIGRVDPQKQPDKLIEAFELIHAKLPEVTLHIVGSGNLIEQTKELVKNKKLDTSVVFEGVRKDMENVYAATDLVILSSAYEGMPNALIEAIGCGIPVVSFDCPIGPSEIIEDGVNGFLAEQDNVEELADKALQALKQSWDEDIIRATCKKFDVKNIAGEYEKIFSELV